MDLFGARLRTDPVEEVRLLFKDAVEALTVDFELFTKLLPNEIFRLAALLLTLPLPPPLPLLLLPLSESVGDAALTLELLPKGGVGAVRGMFMRSKIESFELADFGGCGGGPRFVLRLASVALICVLLVGGCGCCCCCCFWRFNVKCLVSSVLKSMGPLLAFEALVAAGGLLLRC